MEAVLIIGFVVIVIVGNKLYKKRLAHMSTKPQTSSGVGGGTFDGGSGQHDDGSVTPPKPEGENAQ